MYLKKIKTSFNLSASFLEFSVIRKMLQKCQAHSQKRQSRKSSAVDCKNVRNSTVKDFGRQNSKLYADLQHWKFSVGST